MTDSQRAKRMILLAQLLISCMMAFMMSFLFSVMPLGFPEGWMAIWMHHYLTAWPVAFILSLGVGPLAFKMSSIIMQRLARDI
ncbi:MAG: DUF2798 domain-containing protein [Thioclava sp.]|nr:DUF2798 domain-containing protein [Thioclava sp.]MBD3804758.1 DUF2798 domain-containing protein [Thioclava sp.]